MSDKWLKCVALVVAVLAMIIVIPIVNLSPKAHADTDDFVSHAKQYAHVMNIYGDTALLRQGLDICAQLDAGYTPAAAVMSYLAINPAVPAYSAGQLVAIATQDLYQWHAGTPYYGWQSQAAFVA